MIFNTSKSETHLTLEDILQQLILVWAYKGLICIWFWNRAGRKLQTLLSRGTDLFQAIDPNNPEHVLSATMVQWQNEEDSLGTESAKDCKNKNVQLCKMRGKEHTYSTLGELELSSADWLIDRLTYTTHHQFPNILCVYIEN